MYIAIKDYPKRSDQTPELHEYGHMVDHMHGIVSRSPYFRSIHKNLVKNKNFEDWYSNSFPIKQDCIFIVKESAENPSQVFAFLFDRFYYSDESRNKMKMEFPEAYTYFSAFEKLHAFCR